MLDEDKLYIELISKRDSLIAENIRLKENLLELKKFTAECDRIHKIYGKTIPRGGYRGRMRNLPDFSKTWKESTFWKYHNEILQFCFQPLDVVERNLIEYRKKTENIFNTFYCNIVAYCEMAVLTPKGVIFHITDPFMEKDILASSVPGEEMTAYIGKIILLSCLEKPNTNKLQVVRTEILPYTLYDKL